MSDFDTVPAGEPDATDEDLAVVAAQLGRTPRGTRAIAHRCPCGLPDVVKTTPRLPDGTPFPTLFYLTCPRAVHECSRLESAGLMREMGARLAADPDLAAQYQRAHEDYLRRREAVGHVQEIDGVSAGGMPTRVKCLHVHLGHALAVGPGVNPFGDETLAKAGAWWTQGPCVTRPTGSSPTGPVSSDSVTRPTGSSPTGPVSSDSVTRPTGSSPTGPVSSDSVTRPTGSSPTGPVSPDRVSLDAGDD